MLVQEKVKQAVEILNELSVDCWITFVRESAISRDPMLTFLSATDVTWHSAFIVTRKGTNYAIVGELERKSIEDLGVYDHVLGYGEGITESFLSVLNVVKPSSIALNYSKASEVCDGLSHGMYLTLHELLTEIGYADRICSSEKIVSRLRARKTRYEIQCICEAIAQTEEIIELVSRFIQPGRSEKEIADWMQGEARRRELILAWDESHCPAVFTGPETAGAHYRPTDRRARRGHVMNLDFGVKVKGYCSDLQRAFYLLEETEEEVPPEVRHGFETVRTAIELSRRALKPGVQGKEVDAVARQYIVSQGFDEYPHALGHQVGKFAHDGTAILGPAWERYTGRASEIIETGMVFTLEPRLSVAGRGVVTVEEMVLVGESEAEFLSHPQRQLILVT
jgi:Xaa-Pro aminopeptidase